MLLFQDGYIPQNFRVGYTYFKMTKFRGIFCMWYTDPKTITFCGTSLSGLIISRRLYSAEFPYVVYLFQDDYIPRNFGDIPQKILKMTFCHVNYSCCIAAWWCCSFLFFQENVELMTKRLIPFENHDEETSLSDVQQVVNRGVLVVGRGIGKVEGGTEGGKGGGG